MKGVEFLNYLVDNQHINSETAKQYEYIDVNDVVNDMYRTGLMSEEYLVSYLNSWGELPIELEQLALKKLSVSTNVIERTTDFEKYLVTPYSVQPLSINSVTDGGLITCSVPFKYYDIVTIELIRNSLKPAYQTSAWKIQIQYGIEDTCGSLYYMYVSEFIDATIELTDTLNLKQKVQRIFREAIKSDTMDVVFNIKHNEVFIFRKYMNEYHEFNTVKIKPEEIENLRTMLIGVVGKVEGTKIYAEPNVDYKIENINEDGKYEGRVNFMETKYGSEYHVRIIKLEYNKMMYSDYALAPPVKAELNEALHNDRGLIVITGPRGSGKQVFMYTSINEFLKLKPKSFIETLEDPVEATLQGANVAQIEIDETRGYTFAYYLKGWKRHSTSLYMIGELRDTETVEAASVEAASGALVLTSTHAPDCAGLPKKLSMELKGDDILLFKMLNDVRLVANLTMTKKACPKCITKANFNDLNRFQQKFLTGWGYSGDIYVQGNNGEGCDYCRDFNYKKVGKRISDGNIYDPLIVVETLKYDIDVLEILSDADNNLMKQEREIRTRMIKEGRYKAQIALGLMHNKKITLEEVMKHFTPNIYCKLS